MAIWEPLPGETPIDDISGLRVPGIKTRRELSIFEAENIDQAMYKYLAGKPTRRTARFDFTWCIGLHKEMFADVWDWAGVIRTGELSIGIPSHQIRGELLRLIEDLESWTGFNMDLLEQAARLHHRAVQIHPFQNGNGRWARLLANIWLKLHGEPVVEWPETAVANVSTIRDEYLAAIREADTHGDYAPLVALQRRFTGTSKQVPDSR